MKRKLLVISVVVIFSATAAFIGCTRNTSPRQNTQNTTPPSTNNTNNTAANNSTANKTFTLADLKNYTGQNGSQAYVAVNGTVYDVTNARKWRNGRHENGIVAGVDLTNMMGQSPHGTSVLSQVPVVGTLK